MDQDAASKSKKHCSKGKGKKKARVAAAGMKPYMPEKVPSSRDAHLQVIVVSLEAANAILPSSVCTNPMLPLAAMLTIFKAMLDSLWVAPKDKA